MESPVSHLLNPTARIDDAMALYLAILAQTTSNKNSIYFICFKHCLKEDKFYVEEADRVGGRRRGTDKGYCGKTMDGLSNSSICSWQSKFNKDSMSCRAYKLSI